VLVWWKHSTRRCDPKSVRLNPLFRTIAFP
jgi:hypothetical protein